MKTAFLFVGQGAQHVGMGQDFYNTFEDIRALYTDHTLDFDLAACCFNGPEEKINDTAYAQACLLITSYAIATRLKKEKIIPDVVAGLSLGEYSALTFAGAFTLKDALTVVRKRGQLMAHALPEGTGMMAAVLGADETTVQSVCDEVASIGICEIANYNCPGQLVISGEAAAVKKAREGLLERGVRRVLPLKVSGAFHSSLLKTASLELEAVLDAVSIEKPVLPVVYNVAGDYAEDGIKDLLVRQIYSSVYFEKSIRRMLEDGVDTFIEIGPGKACSGFVKKIDASVAVYNVEDLKTLNTVCDALKRGKNEQ